jgi:hypothetical protein
MGSVLIRLNRTLLCPYCKAPLWLIPVWALVFQSQVTHGQAAKKGDENPTLRWESESIATNGGYLFNRSVTNRTGKPLFVHWPLAGCQKTWINGHGTWERKTGPFGDPTTGNGNLEYTLEKKEMPTVVFRGMGEPTVSRVATSIKGELVAEGKTFRLDFTVNSEVKKADGSFTYGFTFLNRGSPVLASWETAELVKFRAPDRELPTGPFRLQSNNEPLSFSLISRTPPKLAPQNLTIMTEDRTPITATTIDSLAPQ